MITSETPTAFAEFKSKLDYLPAVFFDSNGGDLVAALELGHQIRKAGLDTFVGGPYEQMTTTGGRYSTVVERGSCFSACVYAFAGGVSREITDTGRVGVHQFRGQPADAGERVTQVTATVLGLFTEEMGVDRHLLDLASLTEPSALYMVDSRLARSLNLDNTHPETSEWRVVANATGELAVVATQRQNRRDAQLTMSFSRAGDKVVATLLYSTRQTFRSNDDMDLAFGGEGFVVFLTGDPREAEIEFIVNGTYSGYRAELTSPWVRLRENTYSATCTIPRPEIEKLINTGQFTLWSFFAHVFEDIDPTTRFGTKGLRDGLVAVFRQVSASDGRPRVHR